MPIKGIVAAVAVGVTVLAGVLGGWGWAVVTGAVLLFLTAFFWRMGEVGAWTRGWSRRLYGSSGGSGDEGDDIGGDVMRRGFRGRRPRD
ncbi:MAG: hypothetical protein M3Q23_16030 [Actinomycetota bacterium]|nr:hypothetical protein [Actinomycetota bacterium]